MTELDASPAQVRSRLIQAARSIAAEHRPEANGVCPVCRFAGCQALRTAHAYLDFVGSLGETAATPAPRQSTLLSRPPTLLSPSPTPLSRPSSPLPRQVEPGRFRGTPADDGDLTGIRVT